MIDLDSLLLYFLFLVGSIIAFIPIIYGIVTLTYFIKNYQNKIKVKNNKLPLILLFFNFFNLLWSGLTPGIIFSLLWFIASIITDSRIVADILLVISVIPNIFVYTIPFVNLALFILKNKKGIEK